MNYCIIEEKNLSNIIDYLISKKGLPSIHKRLNIYSKDDNTQIEIMDNQVYYGDSNRTKFNKISNKNLKHFFKSIQDKNKKGFEINDIVLLKFADDISILFNTYHGNILSGDDLEDIAKKFKLKIYENIKDHEPIIKVNPEYLFDGVGNLNTKVRTFANQTGLDIRSVSSSLRLRLSNISNDYSYIEKYYELITGSRLLSTDSLETNNDYFKSMSIIIPAYNQKVTCTLFGIQGQNLCKENKEKIQVIIIDDGSNSSVKEEVDNIKDKLDFEVIVITLGTNMGISNARNAGLAIAKHDLILFMDSDIVLSKDYLYDINLRLQIIPNAILVAMRKNIDKRSALLKHDKLLSGTPRTLSFDDSRVVTVSKEYHIGWDKAFKNEVISILDDTNYFKELSFGSRIGIYDLPSVVTGHNIAINRCQIKHNPVFSNKFHGWGLEDAYFASQMISNGCYVIPVISSNVYHINHPPRSGSMEQKRKEAAINFEIYNNMLDECWYE